MSFSLSVINLARLLRRSIYESYILSNLVHIVMHVWLMYGALGKPTITINDSHTDFISLDIKLHLGSGLRNCLVLVRIRFKKLKLSSVCRFLMKKIEVEETKCFLVGYLGAWQAESINGLFYDFWPQASHDDGGNFSSDPLSQQKFYHQGFCAWHVLNTEIALVLRAYVIGG